VGANDLILPVDSMPSNPTAALTEIADDVAMQSSGQVTWIFMMARADTVGELERPEKPLEPAISKERESESTSWYCRRTGDLDVGHAIACDKPPGHARCAFLFDGRDELAGHGAAHDASSNSKPLPRGRGAMST